MERSLHNLDYLKQGISLRAYGQKDPLNEYKREAFNLFEHMLTNLKELFIQRVCYLHIDTSHLPEEAMSLEHKELQPMHQTREDPAFSKYNSGRAIETKLKAAKMYVALEERLATDPASWGKIARNEPCPCESGKKYKHCHGIDE
jgi:preprotein translocase subunit SecA